MPDTPTPWVGLAALVAMFLIPFLPDSLFEGPRTTKHWPRRHICGECAAPWTRGHSCVPHADLAAAHPPLRGEFLQVEPTAEPSWVGRPARTVTARRLDEANEE
jgi:hypothetical protein